MALFGLVSLLSGMVAGSIFGIRAAAQEASLRQSRQLEAQIQEQFDLGVAEMEAGEYARAAQRFEWILIQQPENAGALEKLADAYVAIYVGQEQITDPLIPSPTPTQGVTDPALASEMFVQATGAIQNGDWQAALDDLVAVRQADPAYEPALVDRLLYLSLRQRGVELILSESELEGGLYYLALVERFAPLDVEADNIRSWARLYLIGASFWGILPDRAAFYFGQLASAAPYLSDSSGMPAIDRYFYALSQYGDQLFGESAWCEAAEQYGLALNIRQDPSLEEKLSQSVQNCENPAGSENEEITPTETMTLDPGSLTPTETETPTPSAEPATPTPSQSPTEESTPEPPPASPTEEPTATPEI